jgi:hypothetical protein
VVSTSSSSQHCHPATWGGPPKMPRLFAHHSGAKAYDSKMEEEPGEGGGSDCRTPGRKCILVS